MARRWAAAAGPFSNCEGAHFHIEAVEFFCDGIQSGTTGTLTKGMRWATE